MIQWTDRKGQTWDVLITHGLCDRVKEGVGVDLYRLIEDGKLLGGTLFDGFGRKLVEIMYVVCEPQITDRKLEPEAWADLFDGPTVEAATKAFLQGLSDFFPRSRIGQMVRENMDAALAEMDETAIKRLRRKPGGFSGPSSTSPGSAA